MISKESVIHRQVCDYLRLQYPNVLFRTDMGGVRLTMGQARAARATQHGRAWPDLFIAEQRYSKSDKEMYGGLFIELKATNIYKKDGTLKSNTHVQEQADVLKALADRGYLAVFAVGFEEAKSIIDSYLS